MLARNASIKLRSKEIKYTRLKKLNSFATVLTFFIMLATVVGAAAYLVNPWYVVDDNGAEAFYSPLYVCSLNRADCSVWETAEDFSVVKASDASTCTTSSTDLQIRVYVQWILSGLHAVCVLLSLVLVCVLNCRPTRRSVSMVICILLVLGTASSGVNAIVFPFTLNAFLFCGEEYCSIASSTPSSCTNGISWGFYIYCGAIFCTLVSAGIAVAMRLVLFNADTAAEIEEEVHSSFRYAPSSPSPTVVRGDHRNREGNEPISQQQQHASATMKNRSHPTKHQQQTSSQSVDAHFGDLRMEESQYVANGYDDDEGSGGHAHRQPAQAGIHDGQHATTSKADSPFTSSKVSSGKVIGGASDWVHDPRQPTYLYSKVLNCFYDEASMMFYEVNAGTWSTSPPARQ